MKNFFLFFNKNLLVAVTTQMCCSENGG